MLRPSCLTWLMLQEVRQGTEGCRRSEQRPRRVPVCAAGGVSSALSLHEPNAEVERVGQWRLRILALQLLPATIPVIRDSKYLCCFIFHHDPLDSTFRLPSPVLLLGLGIQCSASFLTNPHLVMREDFELMECTQPHLIGDKHVCISFFSYFLCGCN